MFITQPVLRALSVALLLLGACADVPADSEPTSSEESASAEAADAPSVSAQELRYAPPLVSCGGFLGTPCPGALKCVDDPRDDCDPRHGGADCSGVCVCRPTHTCPAGSVFDSKICGCRRVPVCPNPCAFTTCAVGSICEVNARCEASCVPRPPCQPCPAGFVCPQVCRPVTD